MTVTLALLTTVPPCPEFCTHCVNQLTEPSTDSGFAWHMGHDTEINDEYHGHQIRAIVTVERMDDWRGTGPVRIQIDAQGSLSVAKARELAAALTEQAAIAEGVR